jgi:hypothetical protein
MLIGWQAVNDSESQDPQQTWLNYVMGFLAGECLSVRMTLLLLETY